MPLLNGGDERNDAAAVLAGLQGICIPSAERNANQEYCDRSER